MGGENENLIVTRAGCRGLYRQWLGSCLPGQGGRNFDLAVVAYEPGVETISEPGVSHHFFAGPKVQGLAKFFAENPDVIDKYKRIALIDDDVAASGADLGRCFDLGAEYGLGIWQPSLTWDSYVSYGALLRNPLFRLRYVNFVEMMCPFFAREVLRDALPLFALGLESGVDWVWAGIASERGYRCAVIDETAVRHTRPVGGRKEENGFVGRDYRIDIALCLDAFGLERRPACVAYQGVDRRGRRWRGRAAMTASAFPALMASVFSPRGDVVKRVKLGLRHLQHQATRKPLVAKEATARLRALPPFAPSDRRATRGVASRRAAS